MAGLGAPELIIVLVIVLVIFGGAKLPKLARSLGDAQREFKKGSEDEPADEVVVETVVVEQVAPPAAEPVVVETVVVEKTPTDRS